MKKLLLLALLPIFAAAQIPVTIQKNPANGSNPNQLTAASNPILIGNGQKIQVLSGGLIEMLSGSTFTPAPGSNLVTTGGSYADPSWITSLSWAKLTGVPTAGTVSSVALTVPSGFSVSGSPVTSSGTLAVSFATGQEANSVLATPDNSTGALSIRALVPRDIPSLTLAKISDAGTAASHAATDFATPQTSAAGYGITNGSNLDSWAARTQPASDVFASGTAGKVLATPSGSSGVPSIRALVASDIPSLTLSKISDASTLTLPFSQITSTPTSAAGYGIANGSNLDVLATKTYPAGAVVGTTDAQTLTNKSIDAAQLTGTIAAGRLPSFTGDVTNSGAALTISAGSVGLSKMANLAAYSLIGNNTASALSPPIALTTAQAKTLLAISFGDISGLGNSAPLDVGVVAGTVAAGDDPRFHLLFNTLGETIYAGASSGNPTILPGNTSTTRKYYAQTGDGTNSAAPGWVTIAPTDLPTPSPTTLGGVFSKAAVSNQFLTQVGTDGAISSAQPSAENLSNGTNGTGAVVLATGNAGSATKLATARAINGVSFDGTAPITITAIAPNALTIGTHLTGTSYNGSAPITIATDAASANTVSTIVARDASGNFSAGTITANLTGTASAAPLSGVTGLGTGVATALAVNVGTAGAPLVNGGALGTPSSGVATNLTGTAAGLTAGTANAAPASGLTGTTLASNVINAPGIYRADGSGGFLFDKNNLDAIVFIGDSISTGTGASNYTSGFSWLTLRSLLNSQYTQNGADNGYTNPIVCAAASWEQETGFTTTGTTISAGATNSRVSLANTQTITITGYAAQYINLLYDASASTGSLIYKKNGSTFGSTTTISGTGIKNTVLEANNGSAWLPSDSITITSSGGTVQIVGIGVLMFSSHGPAIIESSQSGTTFGDWDTAANVAEVAGYTNPVSPNQVCYVLNLGTNSIYSPTKATTPTATVAAAASLIAHLTAATTGHCSFVLAVPPRSNPAIFPVYLAGYTYEDYRDAIVNFANANGYPINRYDLSLVSTSTTYLSDGVHPNNTGHALMAWSQLANFRAPLSPNAAQTGSPTFVGMTISNPAGIVFSTTSGNVTASNNTGVVGIYGGTGYTAGSWVQVAGKSTTTAAQAGTVGIWADVSGADVGAGLVTIGSFNAGASQKNNIVIPKSGRVLINTTTDDGVNQFQVSGSQAISGNLAITGSGGITFNNLVGTVQAATSAGSSHIYGGTAYNTGAYVDIYGKDFATAAQKGAFTLVTDRSGSDAAAGSLTIGSLNAGTSLQYNIYIPKGGNVIVGNSTTDDGSNKLQVGGDVAIVTAGKTFKVKSGANAAAGTVTLVAGAGTITSAAIDTNTVIVLSIKTSGGTPSVYKPNVAVASGSATITGLATDTSTYNWVALKVN